MHVPTVLWAQRKDKLFVTLDVQDVKDQQIKIDNDGTGHGVLHFSGKAGAEQTEYALDITFFKAIKVEESQVSVSPRQIFLVIAKAEADGHWPRLTKDKEGKATHIKVDWSKYVDEDEEDEAEQFDMSKFGNFSNFGGDDDSFGDLPQGGDSDDEELPDLEK